MTRFLDDSSSRAAPALAPLATQDTSSGLPLRFRSTIYLDVFGWHSRHISAAAVLNAVQGAEHWENPEKMLYEAMATGHNPEGLTWGKVRGTSGTNPL